MSEQELNDKIVVFGIHEIEATRKLHYDSEGVPFHTIDLRLYEGTEPKRGYPKHNIRIYSQTKLNINISE